MLSIQSKKLSKPIQLVIAGVFLIVSFQNCSQSGFELLQPDQKNSPSQILNTGFQAGVDCQTATSCQQLESQATGLLSRLSQNVNSNCFTDSSVNACLFYKNPVAGRGGTFSSTINSGMDLIGYQTNGVIIDSASLDGNGCLTNSTYNVQTHVSIVHNQTSDSFTSDNYCSSAHDFKVRYYNNSNFSFSAVTAHYYLNLQSKFMTDWVGNWFGSNKGTTVFSYVDDSNYNDNACFSGQSNGTGVIIMGAFKSDVLSIPTGTVQESALSAEAFLHEAGHGNIFFASGGQNVESTSTHKACGRNNQSECCVNAEGCYAAMNEGLADYHAIIMFPNSPIIGETIVNSVDGFKQSGIARNYVKMTSLTPSQVYSASSGEIHAMGYIWGSIWYEARKNAQSTYGVRAARSVDRVFSKHLTAINGSDTFRTACAKVVSLAGSVDSGLVQSILQAECSRRGF